MKLKLTAALLAATLSSATFADNYFGANYSMVDLSVVDLGGVDPTALQLKYGSMVHENVGIEGRLGLGISDDSGVDIDNFYGVYASFQLDPEATFNPYGILGFSKGKVSGFGGSVSESDISYGIGADINVAESVAINIEWINYYDKDDVEATAINLGGTWRF